MTLSAEQQTARKRSVGSTDSAAVLGFYHPELAHLSTMKNAGDVWLRLCHGIDLPSSAVMTRGTRVEPLLRKLYRDTIGPCSESPGTMRHPKHSWMVGSADGLTPSELVELKTSSIFVQSKWGEPGTDHIPAPYHCQIQHLLEVAERDVAVVLTAFGRDMTDENNEPLFAIESTAVFFAKRDQAFIDEIVACGARFMREFVDPAISPMKPLKNIKKWQAILKQHPSKEQQNGQIEDRRQVDGFEPAPGSPDAG